jgi:hypothetical protein
MALHGQDTSYEILLHEERCTDLSLTNNFCSLHFATKHCISYYTIANCVCVYINKN